jgi:Ca2+-binding RTX toxin-like protein
MIRTKNKWLTSLAVTIGCVIPAALSVGCASDEAVSEDAADSAATLGVEIDTCSDATLTGYDNTSSALDLTMGTVTSLVFGVVNGYVTVNGYPCVKDTGVKLTPAMVKKVSITGTASQSDKVVIDTLSGAFGATILAATGGITVDLVSGSADTLSLRGSSGADKWSAGVAGSDTIFELSGDTTADLIVKSADSINVSLSSGNDIFTGQGGAFTATHLVGSATTMLTPVALAMTVNGGDGDDVITGGNGADTINGGNGNDTFKSAASLADGNDTFVGGAGTDKADYSARTANLTFVMDGMTTGGEGAEADTIGADVEDFVGGTGNDTITGNALGNHIQGGAGNDLISGGPAGNCATTVPIDADVLDGEAGNDTFNEGAAADCGDVLNGGAGTDRADYQARLVGASLSISLDGTANDGDPAAVSGAGEKDNVKADVEIVLGGIGNDTIIGSANNDELHGGPGNDTISGGAGNDTLSGDSGNDTLNGEAGDDTFDESGLDPEYGNGSTEAKGTGNDIMNGGTHDSLGVDTVSYASRTADLTATICMDATKLTGGATTLMTSNCTDSDGDPAMGVVEADKLLNVTHLIGGTGIDHLYGDTADDIIEGGAGADFLYGGAGNDTLFGDDGIDTMAGDAGDDYLDGEGAAADGATDLFNGDTGGSNLSDADICITEGSEVRTNCEL